VNPDILLKITKAFANRISYYNGEEQENTSFSSLLFSTIAVFFLPLNNLGPARMKKKIQL